MIKFPITATLIKNARNASELKQVEFIKKNNLNITQATFSRWETGQIQVPATVLFKLGLVGEAIKL